MNKKLFLTGLSVFALIATTLLIIVSAGSGSPSVSTDGLSLTIGTNKQDCTTFITFGVGCTDSENPYDENLRRITNATYRNTQHDQSPYINTASDQLPINDLLVDWRDYYNPVFKDSGGLLPGLDTAGQFRVSCEFSHLAYDDPIVFPGQPGASHLHMFFGNTHSNAHSTYKDIIDSGSSTCNGQELNRTSYWVPAMFDQDGMVRVPDRLLVYYKSYNSAVGNTQIYPPEMALIAGNAMATSRQPSSDNNIYPYLSFGCTKGGAGAYKKSHLILNCPNGDNLEMNVKFQTCWNGKDPSNYKENAAFAPFNSNTGLCPDTHTIKLPQMEYRIFWGDHGQQSQNWYLSSDVDASNPTKLRTEPGITIHGDWWGGWNKDINQTWINNCNNIRKTDCADGLLGDPRITNNPRGLKQRPAYDGPKKLPAQTILQELCPANKQYVNKYSPALCDTSAMLSRMSQ